MKLQDIMKLIEGQVILGEKYLDHEVKYAFGSDLMSDVLAFTEEDTVLLTGLINNQVIRTAEMLDIKAIVFVRGKFPSREVIDLAKEYNMILLTTEYSMYTASGLLYSNGLLGTPIKE